MVIRVKSDAMVLEYPEKYRVNIGLKVGVKFRLYMRGKDAIKRNYLAYGQIDKIEDKFIYCHITSNNDSRILRKAKLSKKYFMRWLTHVFGKNEIRIPYETYVYFDKNGREIRLSSNMYDDIFRGKQIHFL